MLLSISSKTFYQFLRLDKHDFRNNINKNVKDDIYVLVLAVTKFGSIETMKMKSDNGCEDQGNLKRKHTNKRARTYCFKILRGLLDLLPTTASVMQQRIP